jgi:carboxyl-terminal processing protease
MVAAAPDSHTSYLRVPAPELRNILAQPHYGFQYLIDRDRPVVFYVQNGSQAELGDVRVGDVLLSVNGARPLYQEPHHTDASLEVKILRGNSDMTLELMPNFDPPKAMEIRRLDEDLGYIRISTFNEDPESFFGELNLATLVLRGVRGVVIDLRNNPGGALQSATTLAAFFGSSETSATWTDRDGKSELIESVELPPAKRLPGLSLVVLVNKDTYSAAETAAYLLQQSLSAVVVGSATPGAVRGGASFNLGTGRLSIGVAKVLLGPDQVDLEGVGVTPNIELSQNFKLLRKGHDNLLETGLQLLRGDH